MIPPYQTTVADFVAEHGLEIPVPARLLDLVSEVGELAKEALNGSAYGRQAFQPPAGWQEELGDTFFALICVANSTDVDLEAALAEVLAKYRARHAATGEIAHRSE